MADITNLGDSNANLTELEMLANEEGQQDNAQAETQETVKAAKPESAEQEKGLPEQDWEKSAKYYQSEKDKMYTENQNLKSQLEKLGTANEDKVQEEAIKPPESFDPWEAYNDPNSESYQFRQTMEEINIAKAVAFSQKNIEDKMHVDKRLQEFDNELTQQGLSAEDKESFYSFANKPLSELGTDKLVSMWQAADGRELTLCKMLLVQENLTRLDETLKSQPLQEFFKVSNHQRSMRLMKLGTE
jgi:hypothetical protein